MINSHYNQGTEGAWVGMLSRKLCVILTLLTFGCLPHLTLPAGNRRARHGTGPDLLST